MRKKMKTTVILVAVIGVLMVAETHVTAEPKISDAEVRAIAEDAFIYFYPMLENYKTMFGLAIYTESDQYRAPFNVIKSDARVLTPADTIVVSPNSDTPYSGIWLDLRAEPMVVSVPQIEANRYYSFQLIDFFTNNFGYIGSRATGSKAGNYLVAGPDWNGQKPAGIDEVFVSESNFVFVIGRTQLFGPDDLDNVIAIQNQYQVQALSAFLGKPAPVPEIDFPAWSEAKAYSGQFINYVNLFLTWVRIAPSETELLEKFAKIGIGASKPFDIKSLDPERAEAIEEGVQLALNEITEETERASEVVNGWMMTNVFGDRDFHGDNYLRRAAGCMIGLYGNSIEEAFYPFRLADEQGQTLDGSLFKYALRFDKGRFPPQKAFWSITMYDAGTRLLIENPIDRYLVNSASELKENPDGSADIHIQYESPGKDKESNWLPAPDGPFYMIMRIYYPTKEALDGTWQPPQVRRVE